MKVLNLKSNLYGLFPSKFLRSWCHSFCFKNLPNITSNWGAIWYIDWPMYAPLWASALTLPLSVLINVVIQTNAESHRGANASHADRYLEDKTTSWCL